MVASGTVPALSLGCQSHLSVPPANQATFHFFPASSKQQQDTTSTTFYLADLRGYSHARIVTPDKTISCLITTQSGEHSFSLCMVGS
eukprot:scaffold15831_cov78-Skeletonema_dohrnii-CCMP3373.AAC.4